MVITFFTLVMGELVPKRLGMQLPQRIAFVFARPVSFIAQVAAPANALLTWSTTMTLKLLGVPTKRRKQALTEEDVRRMLRERAQIPKNEIELIGRVFEFGDHVAKEIMVPRTQMMAVTINDTLDEAAAIMNETGFSRLPVTGDTVDDIVGLIDVKDLLPHILAQEAKLQVSEVMRPVLFFPDTKTTTDLLKEMQHERTEMVILIDEYGGVAGLVTIEDLVEELVGEIQDPFDEEEVTINRIDERTYLVHGSTDLEAVNAQLDLSLETRTAYETLGGYILSELGQIPRRGDSIERDKVTYQIEAMAEKRIELVRVILPEAPETDTGADAEALEAAAEATHVNPETSSPSDKKQGPSSLEQGPSSGDSKP
jgi:putative hemolysin